MFNLLKSINTKITKVVNLSLVVMLSLMTVFIFAQVIYRYILQLPLSWSEELSRYLFTGITLFGAVVLYRSNGHINMSLLKDMIKNKRVQAAIDTLAQIFTLIFLVFIIYYGFPMTFRILNFNVVSPSMPWFKIGYVYFMLPAAAVLSVFAVLETLISIILSFGKKGAK